MRMDKKVLYFTRFVPAYRVPILNQLNEALDNNLVVCAGSLPQNSPVLKATATQEKKYETIHLQNHFWIGDKIHFQNFHPAFEKYPYPGVVLAEESPRSITLPFLLREARRRGAGRALWGIFYSFNRPFSRTHPLQYYRLRMAGSVEACACYTNGVRERLLGFVDSSNLFVAQNTLDTDRLFSLYDALIKEGRSSVRERLEIPVDDAVLVFTGQLRRDKGTRDLLEVFRRIQTLRDATLIVIGDGEERDPMNEIVAADGIEKVRFLGSVPLLKDSAPYIFAADAMLIPGYVGLAANHALCLGVPLITQAAPEGIPFHAPEIEYIINGENGIISERDLDSLEQSVAEVLKDRNHFSANAIEFAREYLTSQRMVRGLVGAIEHAYSSRQ